MEKIISTHYQDVLNYCDEVAKGKAKTGEYERKSILRFLKDLKATKEASNPYFFDFEKADEIIDFAESLKLPDLGDKPLKLLGWQKFIYYNLFGFYHKLEPDRRRFRYGYVEVARKNGKTSGLLFPLILYDFLTTNSAESYFVSKDEKQSEKSFRELKQIINNDEALSNACSSTVSTITTGSSRIAFFSSESGGTDGYKNSLSVIDEFHCYDTDAVVTSFNMGGRARKNVLTLIITSAGLDISKPCYAENEKSKKVLDNILTDEAYFSIIYAYDESDDWRNPNNFRKANPSLGTILRKDILLSDLQDAVITPSHQRDFISKTCGLWTTGNSSWLPMNKIDEASKGEIDFEALKGQPAIASIDLSMVNDFTVFTLCFKQQNKYVFKHQFYVPKDTLEDRYRKENINIFQWVEAGYITAVEGGSIDFEVIINDVKKAYKDYKILELPYDKWKANEIEHALEKELPELTLIPTNQNLASFSPLTRTYEKEFLDGNIIDTNPVMKWMFSNVKIKPDVNGNYKPLKENSMSTKRIDGVITSIMALDRYKVYENKAPIIRKDFTSFLKSSF